MKKLLLVKWITWKQIPTDMLLSNESGIEYHKIQNNREQILSKWFHLPRNSIVLEYSKDMQ